MTFARIPYIGGPLDGATRDHQITPEDNAELTENGHSYEFSLSEWSWIYKQRWQHVEHVTDSGNKFVIPFRTYSELCRHLGRLQVSGHWTVYDSIAVQSKVRSTMGEDVWKFKPDYGVSDGKPSL
jgi:hypothetical protein